MLSRLVGAMALLLGMSICSLAAAQTIIEIELATNDLIYDPVSERIYASVPSTAGPGIGNTITTINPFTAQIEASVFVGSEPNELAISDDGRYLYVGLDGANAVRRYEIATATPGLRIDLGGDVWLGPFTAEDIEVLPGMPDSIAVSRKRETGSPRHFDVAIYDNGVVRPSTSRPWRNNSNRIEFAGSATTLYGYDNESTGFEFQTITLNADGVADFSAQAGILEGFNRDIEHEQGLIYSTSGRVVEPVSLSVIGTYPASGPVEADANLGRVYFLGTLQLKTYDMETFLLLESLPFDPAVPYGSGSLIRWGPDGLAFRTSEGQVFLIYQTPPQAPVCDVELNQTAFLDGDAIIASRFRLANPTDQLLVVETKFWFEMPEREPVPRSDLNPAGQFDLTPGLDQDFGPIALATVTPGLARGAYGFNCRLVDPTTGRQISVDMNGFTIR